MGFKVSNFGSISAGTGGASKKFMNFSTIYLSMATGFKTVVRLATEV
jgi:hypothetical protein